MARVKKGFLPTSLLGALLLTAQSTESVFGQSAGPTGVPDVDRFTERYCTECHDGDLRKGGLDLAALRLDLEDSATLATWVKIHDRVSKGEMPPKKKARPDAGDLAEFTNRLDAILTKADHERISREGRATERRLNRHEYEESLRDLLELPYLEVKEFLPEDREADGFNKVGDALDVSHVQMARYLAASESALRQAMMPQAERPEMTTTRYHTWEQREFWGSIDLEGPLNRRTFPLVGLDLRLDIMAEKGRKMIHTSDPERREKESMAVVVSTYEPTEIRFGGFRAPYAGRYHLTFSAYSIQMSGDYRSVSRARRSEPVSIYAETPPRSLRKLGWFDAGPDPTVAEMDVWLLAGETIRPDAARLFRSRPPNHKNPLAGPDGMPGVAFQWMEVEGPLIDEWPPTSHRRLFSGLPVTNRVRIEATAVRPGRRRFRPPPGVKVVSTGVTDDARKLMSRFVERAYRHPVDPEDLSLFLDVVEGATRSGHDFTDSMIAGYTAVLCSPGFLYLQECPGPLGDSALAERLSYFLWNSCPDDELRSVAGAGMLHEPEVLRAQTERLLNDPRSRRFVDAFLDYWLDLRRIAGTAPDEELYPDYQLDDLLAESMEAETQCFFSELLRRDLSVTNLVHARFAMLNERLATHYGIPGVKGVAIRRVDLEKGAVRGGLLTQASVLKVTANGTTTSPVKRGAWIMTRLLGKPPPPPPASVRAVEPDIRGATTIREQLARHRDQESCNACHRNIDPAGFALENFDVMGGWRDRYRCTGSSDPVRGIGHNGNLYHFSLGQPVDATGELPDGRKFADVRELKELLAADAEQLALNLVGQFTIYATGAPIGYSDRATIRKILDESRPSGYGVRTLIHGLVQSELFRNK